MMRSLYSGVAGLKTHQTKMDVIGNNIANVNTTSYKSQSITFSDLMYQTTQTASGATETKGGINARQIGLGAKSGAINTAITSQGTTQTTSNPFDIMITGDAFFVVNNGVENLYTRDGSFYVDGAGNLAMQSNGYLVQGWAAQEDRETGAITVNKNGGLSSLQIMSAANYTYAPASTTASMFQGNIDDNDTNLKSADGKTITLEFYDNKGYLYTGKFTLKNTDDGDLFALSLTDIIDSNGKSINDNKNKTDLMSQITFGNVESTTRTEKNDALRGFSIEATSDSNYIDIINEYGDVKYSNIAAKGKLSELNTKGILDGVYGLSETQLVNKYTKNGFDNATYEIVDADGALRIFYPEKDISEREYKNSFDKVDFSTPNTGDYFIKEDAQVAYKVPEIGAKGDAREMEELLEDVFGYDLDTVQGDKKYKYDGSLSIYDKFKNIIDNDSQVIGIVKDVWAENGGDFAQFNGLVAAIEEYSRQHGGNEALANLEYTYKPDGSLTITQKINETKIDTTSSSISNLDPTVITEMLHKVSSTYSWGDENASEIPYSVISNIAGASTSGGTYTEQEIAAAAAIVGVIGTLENSNNASIKLVSLSGDGGIIIKYPTSEGIKKPFPDASQKATAYQRQASVTFGSYQNGFKINGSAPSYVYKNKSTYGKSYYVANNMLERSFKGDNTGLVGFIKDVYSDAENMTFDAATEYKMSISNSGTVTISHMKQDTPDHRVDSANGFEARKNTDGTYNYSTTSAFKNVPVKGNIADLLSTADSSAQKELLSKVYGISDEAADAFGLDGTYEIITAEGTDKGKINLTVGNRTIQLKFDPATGNIVSADGNTLDKKTNITFGLGGKTTEGLEAFGFQASPTNAAELERNHTITIDFSTITNVNTNGSSTIKAYKGDIKSLNTGRAVGEMNGVNVSDNGQIYASYSNGQTKLLGQIASAEFANASGLSKEGDNLYSSTLNSGEATIQDITTDGGYMSTGVLEMSNVDLSAQFTEMITTQRGFQANSRIITVSDTLLEELTNLKR